MPGDDTGARNGELVEVEIARDSGRGLPMARVRERLGDLDDQRNISLIAIHQHGIPDEFPAAGDGGSREAQTLLAGKPRRPAQRAAHHHRSAGCARS